MDYKAYGQVDVARRVTELQNCSGGAVGQILTATGEGRRVYCWVVEYALSARTSATNVISQLHRQLQAIFLPLTAPSIPNYPSPNITTLEKQQSSIICSFHSHMNKTSKPEAVICPILVRFPYFGSPAMVENLVHGQLDGGNNEMSHEHRKQTLQSRLPYQVE